MSANKASLKYSLASRKKIAPKLKNVLAQPLPRYWPEIDVDDRKELRQKLHEAIDGENKTETTRITLGMSSCLRLLQRNEISCLLLSGEIKPKFITTQIILSVINKKETIYVLIVPELKKLTEEIFKISSLTLAVRKGKNSSLVHWIIEKAGNFPVPDRLLKYYSSAKLSKISSPQLVKSNKIQIKPPPENIVLENLYLPRSSSDCRAFIPANATQINSEQNNKWSDFISLSKKPSHPEPMDVDIEPVKTEKMSLKELLQKATQIKNEKKFEKDFHEQKGGSKIEILNCTAPTSSEHAVEPPKIKLKKKKKKQNTPKDNPTQVFNYVSLKVNKIQGNPEKVKNKKKKTKKK